MVWIEKTYQAPPNTGELILGRSLPSLLNEACDRTPNANAFNQWSERSWQSLSNQTFKEITVATALGLHELGLERGDRIALLMPSDLHFCIVDLASLTANLINVPIDLTQTLEHILFILQHSEARALVIANLDLLKQLAPLLPAAPDLRYIILIESPHLLPLPHSLPQSIKIASLADVQHLGEAQNSQPLTQLLPSDPHQIATIVYVPNEAGQLEGVILTHENLSANALASFSGIPHLQRGERETVLSFLPLNHVLARCMIYGHIAYGHSIYFSTANRVMRHLQEVQPTVLTVVPFFLEKVYSKIVEKGQTLALGQRLLFGWALQLAQRYELGRQPQAWYALQLKLADWLVFSRWRSHLGGRVKHLICGGAALKANLANVFAAAIIPILYGYGLTQASAVVCCNRGQHNRAGTVGIPIPGVEVGIAEDGEILLRGAYITPGYYKNPTATQALIDGQGWLHTGDLGSFTKAGFLQITGLKKALFKLAIGKYIAPQPIEQRLKQSPLVAEAIAIGADRKFCAVLIVPNLEALHSYALELGIDLPADALLHHPYISTLYRSLVDAANCHLPYWAKVKRLRLVNVPLPLESSLLTATGHINRVQVMRVFAQEIDALYQDESRPEAELLLPDRPVPLPETFCPTYAQSLNLRPTT